MDAYEVSIFLSINQDYVTIPLNHQIHVRRHCEVQIEHEKRIYRIRVIHKIRVLRSFASAQSMDWKF